MMGADEFLAQYAAALRTYLDNRDEASLVAGYELGRDALVNQISILDIIENHFRLVGGAGGDESMALPFLLQTLATLDVATRGFLDGRKRYEQQRTRAEGLADRDAFRDALVNALQEGFFVADRDGTVVEINDAFTRITGYPAAELPYRWPHPWVVDQSIAGQQLSEVAARGHLQSDMQIRHRDGRLGWAAFSINAVTADPSAFVGTIRDITTDRADAVRDRALVRLATAVGVATTLTEVLDLTLEECRTVIDLHRVVAIQWPSGDGDPDLYAAGEQAPAAWADLDGDVRAALTNASSWPPLTVKQVAAKPGRRTARGMIAVLAGPHHTTLWLEYATSRPVAADDRKLLTAIVGHLSLAVQHVDQFAAARETSLTLQRAMLPSVQPPPGFAVRYEPAVSPLEICGDWYDVLSLGGHRIGVIVGDCVGRGLRAAAVMGQLRSSARALLLTDAQPSRVLDELDAAAALIPGAICTTVFVAVVDTESGTLTFSSAGHPPAVLAAVPTVELLTDAASVPLGVARSGPRANASRSLPTGAALLVYTDGLVERHGEAIDAGIQRAARVLLDAQDSAADTIADTVLRELAPQNGYDDDVAIVVYRHHPPLNIDVAATPERLADVRGRLTGWLGASGVSNAVAADIVLAVNEACTNSVEHAYRDAPRRRIQVHAERVDNEITVRTVDFGTWKAVDPHSRGRGRGLPMMRALSSRVDVQTADTGTIVAMAFILPVSVSRT